MPNVVNVLELSMVNTSWTKFVCCLGSRSGNIVNSNIIFADFTMTNCINECYQNVHRSIQIQVAIPFPILCELFCTPSCFLFCNLPSSCDLLQSFLKCHCIRSASTQQGRHNGIEIRRKFSNFHLRFATYPRRSIGQRTTSGAGMLGTKE